MKKIVMVKTGRMVRTPNKNASNKLNKKNTRDVYKEEKKKKVNQKTMRTKNDVRKQ